jgi:hypothetical protein
LLLYADDDYYEPTPQSCAMRDYLHRQKKMTEAQTEELMLELQLYASMAEDNFEFILDHAMLMGLNLESFADMQDFISLYMELYNHSRMALNRGHTRWKSPPCGPRNPHPRCNSFGPIRLRSWPTAAGTWMRFVRGLKTPCGFAGRAWGKGQRFLRFL